MRGGLARTGIGPPDIYDCSGISENRSISSSDSAEVAAHEIATENCVSYYQSSECSVISVALFFFATEDTESVYAAVALTPNN